MPILAIACTVIVAILVKIKNVLLEKWEDWRGRPLSPPTEIDALYGLLFASFYYLYLQVWRRWCWPWLLLARACPVLTGIRAPRLAPPCQVVKCTPWSSLLLGVPVFVVVVVVVAVVVVVYQVIKNALEPLNCITGSDGRAVMFAELWTPSTGPCGHSAVTGSLQ